MQCLPHFLVTWLEQHLAANLSTLTRPAVQEATTYYLSWYVTGITVRTELAERDPRRQAEALHTSPWDESIREYIR